MSDSPMSLVVAVEDGRLKLTEPQRNRVTEYLRGRTKPVVVKFSKQVDSRSQRQNRFYWGVVLTAIADSTGYATEEVHELMKGKFLPRKFVKIGSLEKKVEKTTTDLTTAEFSKYLEQIAAFAAAELGITMPDPP